MEILENRRATRPGPAPSREPLAFHRRLPGYQPTPLREAPGVAARLGVRRVSVKDESNRLGLPAFKILGAAWAVHRLLAERFGPELAAEPRRLLEAGPLTLVAATEGNHGRAVARTAQWLGLGARIFVPEGMAAERVAALQGEGATVERVPGGYDRAVHQAAAAAGPRALVVADVALHPGDQVPRWVVEGYSSLFHEIDAQLAGEAPTLVSVQAGVGAFATAVARHYRQAGVPWPTLLVVEPDDGACVLASVRAGHAVTLPRPRSVMAGLNCETPSAVVLDELTAAADAFVSVGDALAEDAMRALWADGISAGASGAAGLAGLFALSTSAHAAKLGLTPSAHVLLVVTEGATDAAHWRRVISSG